MTEFFSHPSQIRLILRYASIFLNLPFLTEFFSHVFYGFRDLFLCSIYLAFLVSSILFGALYGRWLAGTFAGMFYAWAMYRRGRVGDAIIAQTGGGT